MKSFYMYTMENELCLTPESIDAFGDATERHLRYFHIGSLNGKLTLTFEQEKAVDDSIGYYAERCIGSVTAPIGNSTSHFFRKIRKESNLKSPVKAYMSRDIVTIEPGRSPLEASRLMVKYDVGRLPVVESGKVIGIVTRSDAMMYFYDQLPD